MILPLIWTFENSIKNIQIFENLRNYYNEKNIKFYKQKSSIRKMSSLNQGEGRISLPPPNIGMRGASRESGSGSGSMSVINSIANGISKKSFFKGFLGRGGS